MHYIGWLSTTEITVLDRGRIDCISLTVRTEMEAGDLLQFGYKSQGKSFLSRVFGAPVGIESYPFGISSRSLATENIRQKTFLNRGRTNVLTHDLDLDQ